MLKRIVEAICFRLINGPLGGPSFPSFEISKLDMKPGDVLVFRFNERLSAQAVDRVREMAKGVIPDVKVLVLENGAGVAVVNASQARQASREVAGQ